MVDKEYRLKMACLLTQGSVTLYKPFFFLYIRKKVSVRVKET